MPEEESKHSCFLIDECRIMLNFLLNYAIIIKDKKMINNLLAIEKGKLFERIGRKVLGLRYDS